MSSWLLPTLEVLGIHAEHPEPAGDQPARQSKAAHIKELSTEIERLKADLFATREKNGIYMNPDECAEPRCPSIRGLCRRRH